MLAWLTQYKTLVSPWNGAVPRFRAPPSAVVIHSGSYSPNVAEYLHGTIGGDCRKVSAHFAWHGGDGCFVQMVPLTREAWHAGRCKIAGQRANGCSIGIELSGPYTQCPRDEGELWQLKELTVALCDAIPTLTQWVRHSDIKATKRDPGPGFDEKWLDERLVWAG